MHQMLHKLFLYIDSYKRANSSILQGYTWNVLQFVWYLQAASDNCTATYRDLLDA